MIQRLPTEIASSYQSYVAFVTRCFESTHGIVDIEKLYLKNRYYIIRAIINTQVKKDREQAEDIVQDLYVTIQQDSGFQHFKDETHAIQHCINRCKNLLKKQQNRYRYETHSSDTIFELHENEDEEIDTNGELADLIKSRFHLLTDIQRKYIEMQFIDGYSGRQTAKILGKADSTIHKTTKAAINIIRDSFNISPISNRRNKRKPVTQFTLEGEAIETFPSLLKASQETGVSLGNICEVCNGHQDTAGGFLWEYAN